MGKDICTRCCDFYYDNKEYRPTIKSKEGQRKLKAFLLRYRALMKSVLRARFGIRSKDTQDSIVKTLGLGNWEHLWETKDEEKLSTLEIKDNLIGEIFYCSDRWSWDRLLRVNWLALRLWSRISFDIRNEVEPGVPWTKSWQKKKFGLLESGDVV